MKWCLAVFLAFFAFQEFSLAKAKSKKPRYPFAQSLRGSAEMVDWSIKIVQREPHISEKPKAVRKGMVFKDKVHLRTGEKSHLRVELNPTSSLILEENTEVKIPDIEWQDGKTHEVSLIRGKIRYICKSNCERRVNSPLHASVPPPGDYLFEYDPQAPKIQASVLSGELNFRGLENETSVLLKSGEKAGFQGVIESDQLAFDVLLKGRKVAKGKLSAVEKLPAELAQTLLKQEEEAVKIEKKKLAARKAAQRKPSQICDKPWGELNQCAWVCEKNPKGSKDCAVSAGAQCVRMRCNANGQWADRLELPAGQSPCKAQAVVAACDY